MLPGDFHANSLTLAGCYLRFLFVLTLNSVLEVALVENSSDEQNTEEVRHHSNHHDHHRQKTKIKLRLENIKLLSVTSSTSINVILSKTKPGVALAGLNLPGGPAYTNFTEELFHTEQFQVNKYDIQPLTYFFFRILPVS